MNSNSQQELKCNQCLQFFSKIKIPLKMLTCRHNICEQCLKQIRQTKLDILNCQFCGNSITKLQNKKFQTNRLVLNKIKDKNQCISNSSQTCVSINNASFKIQQDQANIESNQFLLTDQEESSTKKPTLNLNKIQTSICKQHDKQLQIICVTDLKMICPHCAIFGNHKDHTFKTLKQFNQDYQHRYQKLQMIKQQKYLNDKKIKQLKQKSNIENIINQKKLILREEISNMFTKLTRQIQLLEITICQDLNKAFSLVYKQMIGIFQQQSKIDQQYNKWECQCQNVLDSVDKNQQINTKIKTLYGPLTKISQGQDLVTKLEKKYTLQNKKLENLVDSVSIQFQQQFDISKIIKVVRKIQDPKKDNIVQMLQKLTIPAGKHIVEDIGDFNQNSFLCDSKQDLSLIIQPDSKRIPTKSVMTRRNPPNRHMAATTKYRSPNKKVIGNQSMMIRVKSNTQIKLNQILSNTSSPNIFQNILKVQARDPAPIIADFIKHDLKQVLDLSRCQLTDQSVVTNLKQVRKHRKIRGLKLCQNYITDIGFEQIIQYISSTTNLNLSYNKLTQQSLSIIINNRDKISPLRIVNLSFNNVNEKKGKARIDALKKMGIIVNV